MIPLTATFGSFKAPVVTEEQEQRVREFERAQERGRWRERLMDSGIPEEFRKAKLAQCHPAARAYVDTFSDESRGLMITGNWGTVKTFTACAILIQLARKVTVRFITMPDYVEECRGYASDLSRYRNVRVLCVDDMGKERPNEFAMEQIYRLIDYRWREHKPTIVTTNHTSDELLAHYTGCSDGKTAEAIMSRLASMTVPLALDGPDRRLS